jgi:hypothetical protein
MLILLFVRGFIFLKKFKLSTFLDFQKKNNFFKNIFFILYYQKNQIADKKKIKKKILRYPMLPKIEFLLNFTNLVPVLSVQKNGGKNSKKRLIIDLSGS